MDGLIDNLKIAWRMIGVMVLTSIAVTLLFVIVEKINNVVKKYVSDFVIRILMVIAILVNIAAVLVTIGSNIFK